MIFPLGNEKSNIFELCRTQASRHSVAFDLVKPTCSCPSPLPKVPLEVTPRELVASTCPPSQTPSWPPLHGQIPFYPALRCNFLVTNTLSSRLLCVMSTLAPCPRSWLGGEKNPTFLSYFPSATSPFSLLLSKITVHLFSLSLKLQYVFPI